MAKRKYHRTAALLSAQPQRAAWSPSRRRARANPLHLPWQVYAAASAVLAILLWFWLDARWYVDVTDVTIQGASAETAWAIAEASEILDLHGLWLRPADIAEQLEAAVPAIVSAEADCWVYPAQCIITVVQRHPVLAWVGETGATWWVDESGALFPAWGERSDLFVVRGPLPSDEHVPQDILEGVAALNRLDADFSGLEYNPRYGLIWTDPEGRRIAWGVGAEMTPRWDVYRAFIAHLNAQGIFPWSVDVRFPAAPTYTLERSW